MSDDHMGPGATWRPTVGGQGVRVVRRRGNGPERFDRHGIWYEDAQGTLLWCSETAWDNWMHRTRAAFQGVTPG